MSTPVVWAFRAAWATLPLTAGPLFAEALEPTHQTFRLAVGGGLWVVWAAALLGALVPHVLTLTPVRIVAPAAVAAAVWAAVAAEEPGWPVVVVAVVAAGAAATLAFSPGLGDRFVDGSSYGDERRTPLRAPVLLAAGPVPVVWAATVAGATAGPLLLASRQWVTGAALTAIGLPIAVLGVRSLHRLARRWLVFVPAGVVVHDHLALGEPTLFPTRSLVAIGPAPADTSATDLTLAAAGTPLRLALAGPTTVVTGAGFGRRRGEELRVVEVLVAPGLPGRALAVAAERGLPIG
jgi:hypothetical protein